MEGRESSKMYVRQGSNCAGVRANYPSRDRVMWIIICLNVSRSCAYYMHRVHKCIIECSRGGSSTRSLRTPASQGWSVTTHEFMFPQSLFITQKGAEVYGTLDTEWISRVSEMQKLSDLRKNFLGMRDTRVFLHYLLYVCIKVHCILIFAYER